MQGILLDASQFLQLTRSWTFCPIYSEQSESNAQLPFGIPSPIKEAARDHYDETSILNASKEIIRDTIGREFFNAYSIEENEIPEYQQWWDREWATGQSFPQSLYACPMVNAPFQISRVPEEVTPQMVSIATCESAQ